LIPPSAFRLSPSQGFSQNDNIPEWGSGITQEIPQILPPFFYYFKKRKVIKCKFSENFENKYFFFTILKKNWIFKKNNSIFAL